MKNYKVTLGLGLLALTAAACSPSGSTRLLSDKEIVKRKTEALVHETDGYYLKQVQVRVVSDYALPGVIDDLKVKKNIDVSVLDKVPGRSIYLLEVNSDKSVKDVVKALKADNRVVMTAKNREIRVESTENPAPGREIIGEVYRTNDAYIDQQWSLNNQGQEAPRSLAGVKGADIGMGGANTEGSYDVVVGVIDTGVDYTHEDLAITEKVGDVVRPISGSNIWINPEEIPGDKINNDNNGDVFNGLDYVDDVYGYNFVERNGDPMDDHGHGTHVSGTIGALRNNFKGISGIAAKVSIMGLKFLSAEGSGSDFDAQLAISYAIDMQKRFPKKKFILSNSWGSAGRESLEGDEDDFLLASFLEAEQAGILSIAAAGNDATSNRFDAHYPSNYSSKLTQMISVASTTNLDQLSSFSSYGYDQVQVAAPGSLILSTVPKALYPNGYAAWSGTSMATPHVTGLAAVLWAANPQMSGKEVKERIMNTVDVLPQLHGSVLTSGRINVKRALENDLNVSVMPVEVEVPVTQRSPSSDKDVFDLISTLKHEGAKQVAVCFSRIDLPSTSDYLEVLGDDYRVRDLVNGKRLKNTNFKGTERELCSAPVAGDTIHLRLYKQSEDGGRLGTYETTYLKVVQ